MDDAANAASTSLFAEEKSTPKGKSSAGKARLTAAQLRELEAEKEKEVVRGYHRIKELWAGMLRGDAEAEREWLLEAEKLVDMFRETRNLFLTSRVSRVVLLCCPCGFKRSEMSL